MSKKLILAMLACFLVLVCAACGSSSDAPSGTEESDDPTSMMSDLADYMTKYSETMQKLDEIDEDSLSDADLAYYTEVNARILKKLSEVS